MSVGKAMLAKLEIGPEYLFSRGRTYRKIE